MPDRRPLVAANWKLNGSRAANHALVSAVLAGARDAAGADVVLCPPFVYLPEVAAQLSGSAVGLGAQDVSAEASGAFTGEVAASMLRDVGCRYVIVGHSERRALYGETDAQTALKVQRVLESALIPILCVGETLEEREAGRTLAVVQRQLSAVLDAVLADAVKAAAFSAAVIAYEPVWAIGTGRTASPDQAQEVHAAIRATLAGRDATMAAGLRILYGGSVKASNAKDLFAMQDIDGGLIGGASLHAAEFLAICKAAAAS